MSNLTIEERGLKVYNDLREILERMDVKVDDPVFATNPKKLGNIGIRCMTDENLEEAWVVIKRNHDIIELVPPLFKCRERRHFTNESTNKDLCDLLNRVIFEYVIDNTDILLKSDNLINDMDDLIQQYQLIHMETYKYNNIEIARASFHKDFIAIDVRCRTTNSLLDEDDWNIDFFVPMVITKNEAVAKRRAVGWAVNNFSNREDIYLLINKKTLKSFNKILKDTIFKNIYEYTTKTNLNKIMGE